MHSQYLILILLVSMTKAIPLLKGSALSPRDGTIDSVGDIFIEASADIRPGGGGNDWVNQDSQVTGTNIEQHDLNQYYNKDNLLVLTPMKVIEHPKIAIGEVTTEQRKPAKAHVNEMGSIPYINCKVWIARLVLRRSVFPLIRNLVKLTGDRWCV